ncbi:MAG: DNA polymerase I [Eubacteriaceae bacterium]|jgi:DNA polymerase-1|nr:DNA polymerase I [Eubacteriaceae bacterium]
MDKKVVVIDAFSLIYKAFYGVKRMNALDGTPTNAVYGFFLMLDKIIRSQKPDFIFAAFDAGKSTFRAEMFDGYKAAREAMPEDLGAQIPVIMDILQKAKIPFLVCEGLEADDLLGYVSRVGDESGDRTLLVTGDRDAYQLASFATNILYSKRGLTDTVLVTPDYVRESYGVEPRQLIDVKALMGDASDNIPGVKGVGEKTALLLIQKYGSLDGVYENIEGIAGKAKERLLEGKAAAYMSRSLAEIRRDAPVQLDYRTASEATLASQEVFDTLSSLQLANLIRTIGYEPPKPSQDAGEAKKRPQASFLNEVPLGELEGRASAFFLDESNGLYILGLATDSFSCAVQSESLEAFGAYFSSEKAAKETHGLKGAYRLLWGSGLDLAGAQMDTEIAAYLLSSGDGRYSLGDLGQKYLGEELMEGAEKTRQLSLLDAALTQEGAMSQAAQRASLIFRLSDALRARLVSDGMWELYEEMELPLIRTLAEMELVGFSVDSAALRELGAAFAKRSEDLTAEILKLGGKGASFNVHSTKQLGALLFEEMGLPIVKKTKTGYSTDSEVLEKIAGKHPIVEKIIELRAVSKLENTYITGMLKLVDPESGKIHTSFNQNATTTGRLSSSSPNLQNIPIRTEEGRIIRKAFVAAQPGWLLVDCDYSQIELRVLAHVSGDEGMISSFLSGADIHQRTASEVFSVPLADVTREMRSAAKAVNFGIVYGISDFGLSKNLNIPRNEAKTYIERYLERFPGVQAYMASIVDFAREKGYVETLLKRRCYIPGITSRNYTQRAFAERVALNAPIQGTAADIMKIAMIRVQSRLKKEGFQSKLILQVHDELLCDCPPDEAEDVAKCVKAEMEFAAVLKVPLICDTGIGHSWFDAK